MTTETLNQPPASRVAIVAVNWNGWRETLACLESVRRLDYPDYLMIVVDNASEDDSLVQIEEWARRKEGYRLVVYREATAQRGGEDAQEQVLAATLPRDRAVLIRSGVNSGPTGGGNLGIEYALRREPGADWVFLLDYDAQVERDTLTQLVEVARKKNAGIVGGAIRDLETGRLQYAERTTFLRWFFNPLVKADLPIPGEEVDSWPSAGVSGGAMLIRQELLRAIFAATGRYLAAETFMDGWEFEICYRGSLLGYPSFVTRKGFVRHKGERASGSLFSSRRYYYLTRNRVMLARSFLPFQWRTFFHFFNLVFIFGRVLKMLKNRRPDVARAIICGWRDGYRGVTGKWEQHEE
jgi:hypothetical protein